MKRTTFATLCAFFAITTHPSQASAGGDHAWNIINDHSSVGFAVRHLMVSKVRGTFRDFSGTVMAPADGRLTSIDGVVKTTSVDTGNKTRDDHLRSSDFFDSAKFPEMKAKTKKVTWDGDRFSAEAQLTIKGVTRTVTVTGEFLGARTANFGAGDTIFAGYTFFATINRKDFGLNFAKVVNGTAVVDDKVELSGELQISAPAK